jgi:hypothetical protein
VMMRLIAWENPDTISLTICQSPITQQNYNLAKVK